MLEHAREAIHLCRGRTRPDLDTDRQFQLALVKLLEVVGEAARRTPQEVRFQYSAIPWAEIVGLRSWLVHAYDTVDHDVVWETVRHDLPRLVDALAPGPDR